MDIKAYREKHGLSQKAFGALVGVSQGMVWQWETNVTDITLDKAKDIVEATAGQVSAHDCLPAVFPPGFEFPAAPAAPSQAAA